MEKETLKIFVPVLYLKGPDKPSKSYEVIVHKIGHEQTIKNIKYILTYIY